MDANLRKVLPNLIGDDGFNLQYEFNNFKLTINPKDLHKVIKGLKDHEKLRFCQLTDLTAVDRPDSLPRFKLIYILLSMDHNARIIVYTLISEKETVDSITSLFPCANWYEREVWDLFGISFKNHPDLRRILTDYGFNGFPLRKDFPLSGNVEVRYDLKEKKVIYEPIKLTQDFRDFDFESPWEGKNIEHSNE
tara:strand:- start:60 stop:638 length:579 start_codon:yes stop_codon:yes gene_type:complete